VELAIIQHEAGVHRGIRLVLLEGLMPYLSENP
jgi:hypothetical protein